jgi:hypothetical protein
MGPTQIGGVPAHPLLIHAVVTLVPLSGALVFLAAVWPAARRRLAAAPMVVALIALITIPPTTHAGMALQRGLAVQNPLITKHVHLGKQLLPWMSALFAVSLIAWLLQRRQTTPAALRIVVSLISVVVAVGTVWTCYRIGESGAKAVWNGVKVA